MQTERKSGVQLIEVSKMVGDGTVRMRAGDMCRAVLVRHIVQQMGRFDDDTLRDVLVRLVAMPSTQEVAA